MDTCCESRTENKSYVRYDLLRFPVLMRSYGWRAETPALLGRRAYLYANGCGLLSCSGRLIAQLPAWDSLERTAGNCRMDSLQGRRWYAGLCLPGRSASVKEGDQNSGAPVLLSDRRPHRGNFQTEAAAIRQLAGFFQGLRAANGGIRELSGHWEQLLFEIYGGNITCPQSCPFFCGCLRFFVSLLEPQKQKKSAQLKALRTFLDFCGL